MNADLQKSTHTLLTIRIIVSLGPFAGIIISWKLWQSADRLFPLIPPLNSLSLA